MTISSERIKEIPTGPGCYIYFDGNGVEIYVGKAKNLRKRVSSYFQSSRGHPNRTLRLVHEAVEVKTIDTDSEVEALLLENRLIKDLQPRFNVNLKDDKDYPLLAISREEFPRVFITRNRDLKTWIFMVLSGSATQLRRAYHFLMRAFRFRNCELDIKEDDSKRPPLSPVLITISNAVQRPAPRK